MKKVAIGIAASLLLLAIVYVAWGGIKHSSTRWNHTSAISTLRGLWDTEIEFRNRDLDDNQIKDFWVGDVSRLYYLEAKGQPLKLILMSVAEADGAPKGPLVRPEATFNYRFAAIATDEAGTPYDRGNGRNPDKFAFCAYPDQYRRNPWYLNEKHGTIFTFIINEAKTVWKKDLGGAAVTRWPKDPAAEGWSRLD